MYKEVTKVNFDSIPASLKILSQWVVWRWEEINGRRTKPPYQENGKDKAKTSDPETWGKFDSVRSVCHSGNFDGVGIVIRDDLIGIDLDHVIHDGQIEPWAQEIIDKFHGTYIEISPSGDGFHILARGTIPRSGKFGPENRLECYSKDSSRYLTVTGNMFGVGMEVAEQQEALDWMFEIFDKKEENSTQARPVSSEFIEQSVKGIIERASKAKNNDKFLRLFEDGDISDYPSHSEADLALATILSYWTDDADQLDDIFRQSELYRPDKWDRSVSGSGKTYGEETVETALKSYSAEQGIKARAEYQEKFPSADKKKPETKHKFNGFVQAGDLIANCGTTDWLIEGIIEKSSMTMLFGPSASGKSFVALDWAAHIATGIDWCGHEVEQGAVFYICAEGINGFTRRLRVWAEVNNVNLGDYPLYIRQVPAHLMDSDNVAELAEQIGDNSRKIGVEPKFIVLDTLARNFGGGDENSGRDVGRLVNNIDEYLKSNLGAATMVVHHTGHSAADRARGSSALKAAMDQEYAVEKKGDRRILKCTKMKDGKDDFEFHFNIEAHLFGDGGSAGCLVPLGMPSQQEKKILSGKKRTCLGVLKEIVEFTGIVPPSDVVNQETVFGAPEYVVTKEQWQNASIEKLLARGEFKSDSKPESHRRTFRKFCDELINDTYVHCYGNYCWPAR